MSIFESLKNAIFGHAAEAATPAAAPAAPVPATPLPPITAAATAAATPPPVQVDIGAVLTALAAKAPEKLNWQTSIVDLMKLVGLDSSLANRKALAGELGYTGDTGDSASMNIWLHQQVMQKLAADGGKVPDSLLKH